MQHAMKILAGGLVWFALATCLGSADPLPGGVHEHLSSKTQEENNLQMPMEPQMVKRAWRQMNGGWGKRAWHQMPSSWGKRSDTYSWVPSNDKRGWQKFQGAWGKRGWTADDEWQLNDNMDNEPQYDEYPSVPAEFDELLEEEKRKWGSLTPSWGKRATDWESFRGSWGKRDPAWNNLKGLWGKRSMQDRISS